MRCAAFNTGTEFHMLDHIAPLAELLSMPLITTEELNHRLALRYYPQVETRYIPDLEFKLGEIAAQFDVLFECKFWGAHLKPLFQQLYKKEMRLVFCPHGQSDKGYQFPSLAQVAIQDAVLLYGELLLEMLQDLKIPVPSYAMVGNYRLSFYQKYKSFYDTLAEKEIFSQLSPKNQTLLYAPTWKDADQSTSFFTHGSKVIAQLPSDWNLILKLHPLLEQRDPGQYYAIAALADQKSNVLLVDEFPPVYPLLARSDAYLGDASSVGYDFLAFQKPLYFLPASNLGRLHSCGQMIDPTQNLYSQFKTSPSHQEKQKALYTKAFGATLSPQTVKNNIFSQLKPAE